MDTEYGDISPRIAGFAIKELLKKAESSMVLDKFGAMSFDYWDEDFEIDPDDPAPEWEQEAAYWKSKDTIKFRRHSIGDKARETIDNHAADALRYAMKGTYTK